MEQKTYLVLDGSLVTPDRTWLEFPGAPGKLNHQRQASLAVLHPSLFLAILCCCPSTYQEKIPIQIRNNFGVIFFLMNMGPFAVIL